MSNNPAFQYNEETKIIIKCENCGQNLRIVSRAITQHVTCPKCHHEFNYELNEGTFVLDSSILYWPPPPKEYNGIDLFLMILFLPITLFILIYNIFFGGFEKSNKRNELRKQRRSRTTKITNSVMMTLAKYVGGHPLIPQSQEVVLGLSKTHFTVYSIDKNSLIKSLASISLLDVSQAQRGKPKTAREIHDEDHGHTIDVMEHSPFLSLVFKLEGRSYMASFEEFDSQEGENNTPLEWSNQIIALQYQLMHESKVKGESLTT